MMLIRKTLILSMTLAAIAGCSDDPKPTDTDTSVGLDVSSSDTMTDADDTDDGPEIGVDAGEDATRPAPTLTTGEVSATSLCAGVELTVNFSLSGGDGEAYQVIAELSDRNGGFGEPTYLGSVSASTDGAITAALPSALEAGTGYRVRVVVDEGASVVAGDNGTDITVLASGEAEVAVSPRAVFVGDTVRFIDETEGVVSRTWTFPEDANLQTSTDVAADVSFSSAGVKTVLYEGVTEDGCVIAATLDDIFSSVEVVSCQPSVPTAARVYDASNAGAEEFGGAYAGWLCGAGSLKAAGGAVAIFVEPGATFEFTGGGGYTVYVKSGGTFIGGSGGFATVITEPGAIITKNHSNQVLLECPALDFDYSSSPVAGCVPPETNPDAVAVTAGTFGAGPYCPGANITVPFELAGTVGSTNQIIAQISDENGDFASGKFVGAFPATASGSAEFALPSPLGAGVGYKLRLLTSHPPSVGPASAAFSVPVAAVARIDLRLGRKELVGKEIVFNNTSDTHVQTDWDFGEGADPATGGGLHGITTYTTPGWKTVTLTIVDGNGCQSTATVAKNANDFGSGLEILACEVAVKADAQVVPVGPHEFVGGPDQYWMCGGSESTIFGGTSSAIVEENGVFQFEGGGEHTFYARSGAIVGGGNGGLSTLVYEEGAQVAFGERFANLLKCPVLNVNTASAPSPGCQPYTPPAHTLAFGSVENTSICIDARFTATFTTEGIYRLDNTFRLQASDVTGSFANPVVVGTANGDRTFYARFPTSGFTAGTGYRLRVTSDTPALTSEVSDVITLEVPPSINVSADPFVEPGQEFTITNTTPGTPSFVWKFDDVVLSTERAPTFSFDTFGTRYLRVFASTEAGCTDESSVGIKVVSCNPPITSQAVVVTGTRPADSGGLKGLWVCDGGVASGSGGSYDIFVEDGGTFTFKGGGFYSVYVKSGGTYNGTNGGSVAVYAEEGAILNLAGRETVVKTCAPLTFDKTLAPGGGCQ